MQLSEERAEGRSPRLLPPISETDAFKTPVFEYQSSIAGAPRPNHLLVKMFSSGGCFGSSSSHSALSRRSERESREEHAVKKFLDSHKTFLETYLVQNVTLENLEDVIFRKVIHHYVDDEPNQGQSTPSRYAKYKRDPQKPCLVSLINQLNNSRDEHTLVWELAKSIANAVNVDAIRVFKMCQDSTASVQCIITDGKNLAPSGTQLEIVTENKQLQLVLEAANKKCCIRSARLEDPFRFPDTPTELFKLFKKKNVEQADYLFYQPVLLVNGKTGYVFEMWRIKDRFGHKDEEISSYYVLWGSVALFFCKSYLDKKKERNTTGFLLDFVKSIFEDMVSLDQLIKRILEFAQHLVDADRASMFLVDSKNQELVSTVFDLKYEASDINNIKREIRMPIDRGIAGHVAMSGETMNIPDAYADSRFNRSIDEATGYKTVNILCMPIKVEGKVIGLVQMVNKRSGSNFDQEDEKAFEVFSTFFGLAVHNARLYDRIKRNEQKYKVALEVLSYHNTCKDKEVTELLTSEEDPSGAGAINNFRFDPFKLNDVQKCKSIINMFEELFPMAKFDQSTLGRFVLTVKKNYRSVPYHNFDHGWSVAHAMYNILKCDYKGHFDYHRRLALFVASLCHDLDHRGYTNKYMSETASPLAAMYTTSTLEHHHFNSTVTILQQEGHNIFSNISSEDYKKILGYIRHAILATDLAMFFPNLEKMKQLQHSNNEEKFDWSNPSHCDLAMAISMTAADLSASAKPWKVQIKTVKVIFEEFYAQGDKERLEGRNPIPMMDRYRPGEQPASQVGFLSQICLPCYSVLSRILPRTNEMLKMAKSNLDYWKIRSDNLNSPRNKSGFYTQLYDVTNSKSKTNNLDLPVRAIIDAGEDINIYEEVNLSYPDQSLKEKYRKCLKNKGAVEGRAPIETTTAENKRNRSKGFRKEGECSNWFHKNRVMIDTVTQTSIESNTIIDDSEEDDFSG